MKRESFVFVLSGTLFGLMVGWILGSQQAGSSPASAAAPAASAAPASSSPAAPEATPLDDRRVSDLQKIATGDRWAPPGVRQLRACRLLEQGRCHPA